MAIYLVMEPADRAGPDGLRDVALVRDGFSVLGFLFPVLWLLWNRLWIEALLAFAALIVLGFLGETLALGAGAGLTLTLLVGLYVGLEGATLRSAALRRRGWREWGVVKADNRTDAEIRYVTESFGDETGVSEIPALPARAERPRPAKSSFDLLSYPGGR